MQNIVNKEIRDAARIADIPHWMIAGELGITAETFSKKLRFELPEDEKKRCLDVIKKLAGERS